MTHLRLVVARADGRHYLRAALRETVILPVRLYRLFLSPALPRSCRFEPSCSRYTIDAVHAHGVVRGAWLAMKRVVRCQPYTSGGWDPVPTRRGH